MSKASYNQEKADAFAERLIGIINEGSMALMVSLGHRTKLFDKLAELPPSTSQEIAEKAGLNERYVREWLGAMVTGRVVQYNPQAKKYSLPPEHAAFLTREAAPNNIAAFTQYIPLLGSVEEGIEECFRKGGGVPYSDFPRFQEVMAEDSGQTVLPALMGAILPLVPGLVDRLKEGIDVLDVGCGSGRAVNLLAKNFPKSRFVGYDFSEQAMGVAKAESARQNLENVRFEVKDVSEMGEKANYDLITAFDAIHDQVKPGKVLGEIAQALRPDGIFLMQDIRGSSEVHKNLDHPLAPFLYTISCMHCMTVSLSEGGAGLGTMWGEEKAREMLKEAGFTQVEVKQLPHDLQNSYYLATKG